MKKKLNLNLNLFATFGFSAIFFTVLAFLFPIGTGVIWTTETAGSDYFCGYDFVFGNDACQIESNGFFIAVFVLLIIALVFQILGTVFTLPNPDSEHKFSGFLHLLTGLMLVIVAIIFFFGAVVTETPNETYVASLGFGFIVGGIVSLLSAISSFGCYVLS